MSAVDGRQLLQLKGVLGWLILVTRALLALSYICQYKKGICSIHGRGAKLSWKTVTRKYFHTCIVGPRRKKLVQQKLSSSFSRAAGSSTTKGNNDTRQGELGKNLPLQWGSKGTSVWLELICI